MIFENMVVKAVKPKQVEWSSPKFIHLDLGTEDQDSKDYLVTKGADTFLHKHMKLKPGTSKEVYKKSDTIWNQLKNVCLEEAKDNGVFDMEGKDTYYLVDEEHNLVDIFIGDESRYNDFNERLNRYVMDITTTEKTDKFFTNGKDGLTKLICYEKGADLPNQDFTPVVLIEFNSTKSVYRVYVGILIYKTFTFIPNVSPYIDTDKFTDLIYSLDISDCLDYATQSAYELYNLYNQFIENNVEISVREVIKLLKTVGYKLTLKDDARIGEIQNLNDEVANITIQDFFNTFDCVTGETAMEILSLSELQKVFRYNKLSFMDVLKILSKEYLTYEGSKITCDVLGSLITTLYTKSNDKQQLEVIRNEIK